MKRLTLMVSTLLVLSGSTCEEPMNQEEPSPIVGTWVEVVSGSNWDNPKYAGHCEKVHYSYAGTYLFFASGKYQLEYFLAGAEVTTSGTYDYLPDTTLVLHETEGQVIRPGGEIVILTPGDRTYTVSINGNEMSTQLAWGGCVNYWEKL